MKRLALLVVGAMLATTLALTTTSATNGFYHTDPATGSVGDNNHGFNYGGATEYNFNAPGTDLHPQFYASAESHVANGYVCDLKITVTGVDPQGVPLGGIRFEPLTTSHSPSPDTFQGIMDFTRVALLNVIPYGIGSDIAYVTGTTPHDHQGNSAWGEWTNCAFIPADSGLFFGFQIQIADALKGSYRIHINYHFETVVYGAFNTWYYVDLSHDIVYCYQYCSYNIAPIHNAGAYNSAWSEDSTGL